VATEVAMKIFGVECCVTLHCDWPILKVRKIGGTELDTAMPV